MKRKIRLLAMSFCLVQASFAQQKLDLTDFLKPFYDFSSISAYSNASYYSQESSYDRTGENSDGNGHYPIIEKTADGSLILLNLKGSGVINRMWTPYASTDSVSFYIDNDKTPTLTICYRDMFNNTVYPFVAPLCSNQLGGFYCYLPIAFTKSCKIVYHGPNSSYYQIGYTLYEKGRISKAFSMQLTEQEKIALTKVKTTWNKPTHDVSDFYSAPHNVVTKNLFIEPNQTATLFETNKAGRILGFELTSGADLGELAKNIDIRVSYDNEKSPAILCPLADFFGYSFGKSSMQGLMVGSNGKQHYSWYPMPFDQSAKIELVYRGTATNSDLSTLNFLCKVYTSEEKRNPTKEGKFYTHWNRENPCTEGTSYTFLDIKGKGHLAGLVLQAQSLQPGITGNFEGDDSLVVDGKMRIHGTGSEDIFNGGWYAILDCWDDAMSLPLSGCLEYSIPTARTGGYRFYLSDKMSFDKSLLQTIEHALDQKNLWKTDYTSVSYFYCSQPNAQRINPTAENTKIILPDTLEIYPQLVPASIDYMGGMEAKWIASAAKTMTYTINEGPDMHKSVVKLLLNKIPTGNYKVILDHYKGATGAQVSLWQRQTQLTDWIDTYSPETERHEKAEVGHISLSETNNSLSFHFKVDGAKNQFILSRIILVKE